MNSAFDSHAIRSTWRPLGPERLKSSRSQPKGSRQVARPQYLFRQAGFNLQLSPTVNPPNISGQAVNPVEDPAGRETVNLSSYNTFLSVDKIHIGGYSLIKGLGEVVI